MRKFIGVLGLFVFCFVFTGCALLPFFKQTETTSTVVEKEGGVSMIPLVSKDFDIVEIVFLTSSATRNSRGDIIEGSEITFNMLMKEAQKLGADDIVNLRIDEITTETEKVTVTERRTETEKVTITEYKASALAIKYK
ncbi:MAG: hypothetical protein LBB81_10860 [Treponema sp.]|jgi:hypothetical protein|nr:hypothetical protein [Treponema sp.]